MELRTGCRLHAGLIAPPTPDGSAWHGRIGGGVGWMCDGIGYRMRAGRADDWSATGPQASAVLATARAVADRLGVDRPLRWELLETIPEHAGLGSGTQRALAVARLCLAAWELPARSAYELAQLTGRGVRSAIGLHGFEQGGFLVDGGKRDRDHPGELAVRTEWPAAWRVLLVSPGDEPSWHGERERQAFREAVRPSERLADELCRLVIFGLLPALSAGDHAAFAEALHAFNRKAGEPFAAVQGGAYSGPPVAAAIAKLRSLGAAGVGQSSWGPTVFAVVEDEARAAWLCRRLMWPTSVARLLTTGANWECVP